MERLSVAQRSSPKRTKANNNKKKSGIRVVYISNPVRVRTSESEFLPLVQKLTGRGSDVAENMDKCSTMTGMANESSQNVEQAPDQADDAIAPSLNCGVDNPLEWQLDAEYILSDWIF